MNSLPEPQQTLLNVLIQRNYGTEEHEIASNLKFGSLAHMYHWLKQQGCPEAVIYKDPPFPKRRPQGTKQEPEELPPLSSATDQFKEGVEKLHRALESAPYIQQWHKDGRIVTEASFPKESGIVRLIERLRDYEGNRAEWERVCKEHGVDPSIEEFKVSVDSPPIPGGANRHVRGTITWLIANTVVTGGSVDDLLEALHPCPQEITDQARQKIEEKHQRLLLMAAHLATLIRGGDVKAGQPTEEIAPNIQQSHWTLKRFEELGFPDEELPPSLQQLPPEERRRIKNLQLPRKKRATDDPV